MRSRVHNWTTDRGGEPIRLTEGEIAPGPPRTGLGALSQTRTRRKKRAASSSVRLVGGRGDASFNAFVPAAKALSGAYEEGIAGVLTIIKASLLGSALMLLESCTGYLTSYQTPCREGHICECVQYTTVYRSWLDCRDYGPPVRDARPIGSK